MTFNSNSYEFLLVLSFTISLFLIQFLLSLYLFYKIKLKRKEIDKMIFNFSFKIFILVVCLFLSLLFYTLFIFYLTRFNPNKYHLYPFVFIWKLGMLISFMGYSIVLYEFEKEFLDFRFKGKITYLPLIIGILQVIWPVSEEIDFIIIGFLGLIGYIIIDILSFFFLYNGEKTSKLTLALKFELLGILIYALGSILLFSMILMQKEGYYENIFLIFLYIIHLIVNVIGLTFISYGIIKFKL